MVAITVGLFVVRPAFVASLDSKTCDLLTGWVEPGSPSSLIALVGIDEKSIGRLGRWPWSRDLLAALVTRAAAAGARTVVLDMILSEEDRSPGTANYAELSGVARPTGATNDQVLAGALAKVPSIAGYLLDFDGDAAASGDCGLRSLPLVVAGPQDGVNRAFFRASKVECMAPVLSAAVAGSGFLNASPDGDGKLRSLPLIIERGGQYYPSLALAAVHAFRRIPRLQLGVDGRGAALLSGAGSTVPLESHSRLRLRYRGRSGSFPYASAVDVLTARSPAERLRGRIVIIGASARGLQNVVATPADAAFPDVELQATAIDNLLQGDTYHRPSDGFFWEVSLALLAGGGSILTLTLIRSLWGAVITGAIGAGVWAICVVALSSNRALLSPLPATGVLSGTFVALTMLNYRTERRRAEQSERRLVSAEGRTEEVRQESESRYQRLVENVNDAIITDDTEGRLLFANRRFRDWFGLVEGDIGHLRIEDYVAPEWQGAVREQHRLRVAGKAVPDHLEYEGIRADGTRIWIEALVTTVVEGGRIAGTQSALRDITERKRLEAQYLQSQKMESVGRLAGGVAHDFNNLLTVINGYAELLSKKLARDARLLEMVNQIQSAGERAAELTMQLLTFSRKQVVQPKPLDLNQVVEETQKMLTRVVGEDVEVVSRLTPGLGLVMADRGQINQVLMNLVVNARDSMPDGGRVTIETSGVEVQPGAGPHPEVEPGSYIYLRVTDTGLGMSEEIKRQIFEPFFTTKEKGKGTGLGLATVHSIVRQAGGAIWVESKPGKGSTFHICLPRMRAMAHAVGCSGAVTPVATGSETLLLVEDQDAVRHLTEEMLRSYGYKVLHAGSGSEAIRISAGYPGKIHLLLTDVILPHMNGKALAEALCGSRPEMKVLYLSGYSEEIIGRRGVLDGEVAYLAKPFSGDVLAAKVRETLSGS